MMWERDGLTHTMQDEGVGRDGGEARRGSFLYNMTKPVLIKAFFPA